MKVGEILQLDVRVLNGVCVYILAKKWEHGAYCVAVLWHVMALSATNLKYTVQNHSIFCF